MKEKYSGLDISQFISSILIIFIHSGRMFENDLAHFILKSGLCRIAVPLFLITNGYFYRKMSLSTPNYLPIYVKRQLKTYLLWSVVYLPYGLQMLSTFNIEAKYYPLALIFALLYLGVCYHLWYFPALIFAVWLVEKLKKYLSYKLLVILAAILYSFGALETYSSYTRGTALGQMFDQYKSILFTSKNGLFFAFIFILLGFIIHDFQQSKIFKQHILVKLIISIFIYCLEGKVIFNNQGYDKNFIFSLIILVPIIFLLIIQSKFKWNKSWILRNYSKKIFLLHPMFLEIIKVSVENSGVEKFQGFPLFLSTLSSCLACIFIVDKIISNSIFNQRRIKIPNL